MNANPVISRLIIEKRHESQRFEPCSATWKQCDLEQIISLASAGRQHHDLLTLSHGGLNETTQIQSTVKCYTNKRYSVQIHLNSLNISQRHTVPCVIIEKINSWWVIWVFRYRRNTTFCRIQDRAREDKKVPPLKLKLQNVAQLTAVYWKYKACMTVIILPPMKSTKEINSIQPKCLKAPNSCAVFLKKKTNSNTSYD